MESYVNNDTLVENDISKLFKDSIICPICNNIFTNPIICMKCQNTFCKKCIDNWNLNNQNCPKNCEDPVYQNCLVKKDILSKLKFICVGCGNEIQYDEAEKHHKSCCPDKTSSNTKIPKRPKIRKIESNEIDKYKKEGEEIEYITGKKKYNYIFFILYI